MTSADRPHARVERHGRRGELVLDREDRTNAMGLRMIRELTAGLRELLADDNIGAIVVRGEGDVLCIGMDLDSLKAEEETPGEVMEARIDLHAELLDSHKPIVAALCGPAYGGAAALALSCDFLIAAEDAQINLPEVRLSMVAWMNAAVITRRFGSSQALTLALSARDHSADDLLRLKMATAVFPRDEVVEAVAPGPTSSPATTRSRLLRRSGSCMNWPGSNRLPMLSARPRRWPQSSGPCDECRLHASPVRCQLGVCQAEPVPALIDSGRVMSSARVISSTRVSTAVSRAAGSSLRTARLVNSAGSTVRS